jgi:ubiquinone/menaquinone biosynthesis C-methylase UbiE
MQLRSGIPSIADLDALRRDPYYDQITSFSREFLARHGAAMKGYGRLWGQDPFGLWSRRWEYPYTAQKTIDFGRTQPENQTIKILDAGSGVTFFPYFLCEQLPNAEVICCDSNASYPPMFDAINAQTPHKRVSFTTAVLQKLPFDTASIDVVCCISVLEHTDNYGEIVREFARVTRSGGLLVLTFDLSLDGKFTLTHRQASELLHHVMEYFQIDPQVDVEQELSKMEQQQDKLLSTDYVKQTEPQLLPWRYPMAKAMHDLIKGHGWTGGFRSKAIFCLEARKK